MTADVDLVIVGAGAAGIAAARAARRLGLAWRLVEARGEAGGRCRTVAGPNGLRLDLGASWIHAADEANPMARLARDQGFAVAPDPRRRVLFEGDRRLDAAVTARYGRLAANALADLERPATPSLAALFDHPDPLARTLALHWGRAVCGVEPEEADLDDWLESLNGEDWLVAAGYGSLLASLARDLPVTLNCPVTAIKVGAKAVEVRTAKGTLRARHAVLTVPLPVLATERIALDPPLADETRRALAALPSGNLLKAALSLRGRPLGIEGTWYLQQADGGAFFVMRPLDAEVVFAFFGGRAARELEAEGPRAVLAAAADALANVLGQDVRPSLGGGTTHLWGPDPLALGSYSVARPGGLWARRALREPLRGRVWLAGEATAPSGRQATVAGAWLAGARAVRRLAGPP